MKQLLYTALGALLGALVCYQLTVNTSQEADRMDADTLRKEILALRQQNAQLQQQLKAKTSSERPPSSEENSTGSQDNAASVQSHNQHEQTSEDSFDMAYSMAIAYLQSGQVDEALRRLNKLLHEAKHPHEKNTAIAGLRDSYRAIFDYLAAIPGETDAQLWMLFEIHKLAPDAAIRQEIIDLSTLAYQEALRLNEEANYLDSADHFASLTHLSKMLDFELPKAGAAALGSDDFQQALEAIQAQSTYLSKLKERAQQRLFNGEYLDQAMVFWDYSNIATLDPSLDLRQGAFREEFILATLKHLEHLDSMNQRTELKSRMDYIRWTFSPLLSDERLHAFY